MITWDSYGFGGSDRDVNWFNIFLEGIKDGVFKENASKKNIRIKKCIGLRTETLNIV